ncbi:MAG: TraB/GumN family protein [Planctomycetes bacterium]|nr:TraB/GumN family protein [Planctomycetota bacterium]
MTDSNNLPERTTKLTLDGKDIYLVGTAHVSAQSVEDVKATIETVNPDHICIELCQARYKAMTQKEDWKKMNVFKIIKEKKSVLFLAQLIMSSFYRKLGEKLGVTPGAEMLQAIQLAQQNNTPIVLADRDIEITLKRVWGYLSFWNKLKMFSQITAGLFIEEKIDAELIEQIKETDQLESLMAEFTEKFPEVKKRLIDERDIYLAQKIRHTPGQKIVAVIGAGHVPGICSQIETDQPLAPLMVIPPKSFWPRILKWAIPVAILAFLVLGFFKNGAAHSVENIYIWIFVNGLLSAIGSAIALAHPITIISSFLAAPLTSLNPLIAAGWVAGLVQAVLRKPTVADFENLHEATSTVKGFWTNPVTKILLVVVLANLGSILGTWVAGVWIASRSF